MNSFSLLRSTAGLCFVLPLSCLMAQSPAVSINPMRLEVEVSPGASKTVAFEVQAAASNAPERGRLLLSLTDWTIKEDGALSFLPASSTELSAASWVNFSPAAVTVEPGRVQIVRVTVSVPEKTSPGAYRTAVFLQERPPASAPEPGQRQMVVRVRYTVILHVVVPPVKAHPELVNFDVDGAAPAKLICELTNTGNRHVRPLIAWTIRSASEDPRQGRVEGTVLLPSSRTLEPIPLPGVVLKPGSYEASVVVDFQDGSPQQAMSRTFEVLPQAPEVLPPATLPENKDALLQSSAQ